MGETNLGTLIAMHGLPRSGKSTIARKLSKELNAPIVNRDNIRLALHGQVYAKEAEPFTRAIYKVMIHALFLSGHPVVIADETHYSRASRDFIRDGPWTTEFRAVPTAPLICIQRAYETKQPWLPPVIEEMAKRHEPLGKDELHHKNCKCPICTEIMYCDVCQKFSDNPINLALFHLNNHTTKLVRINHAD